MGDPNPWETPTQPLGDPNPWETPTQPLGYPNLWETPTPGRPQPVGHPNFWDALGSTSGLGRENMFGNNYRTGHGTPSPAGLLAVCSCEDPLGVHQTPPTEDLSFLDQGHLEGPLRDGARPPPDDAGLIRLFHCNEKNHLKKLIFLEPFFFFFSPFRYLWGRPSACWGPTRFSLMRGRGLGGGGGG